jgi:hypothetical protein
MKAFYAACLLSLSAAAANDDGLARCAVIAAPDTRLACYDALAHRPPDATPSTATNVISRPTTVAAPAATGTPPQAAVQAPPTSGAASATADAFFKDPKNFGLTPAQEHISAEGPQSITAHIENISSDAAGRGFVVLDSGQTWAILADNDGRLSKGDTVTIKRAALASFLMTAPSHHRYRVRRVQ